MANEYSSILCAADMNISYALDQCLAELALPEVFIQRAKQMSLVDRQGLFGLRPVTRLDESRAMLYRIHIPAVYEAGLVARIMDAADLRTGGRGCVMTQRIGYHRGTHLAFDTERLDRLCGRTERPRHEDHVLLSCTIPRGSGDALAASILELGICVPIIFFGTGMGLRDKLGLLRITIPVEKEIIWFVVPRSDAELVEKNLIPRARLDIPGKGFLYRTGVHAPAVNLRVRHGKRVHAATMEQVIAALDEVRGSSDWRRVGSPRGGAEGRGRKSTGRRGLFFIGEEEEVDLFRRTAMECGARGATLNALEMHSYTALDQGQGHTRESHSRELCDIITTAEVEEKIFEQMAGTGLFDEGRTCVLKTFDVEMPIAK